MTFEKPNYTSNWNLENASVSLSLLIVTDSDTVFLADL